MSINRTELIAKVAEKAGLSKTDADKALAALQEVLVDSLGKGEAVKITGLMAVERTERAARKGRNPRTAKRSTSPPDTASSSPQAPPSRRPSPTDVATTCAIQPGLGSDADRAGPGSFAIQAPAASARVWDTPRRASWSVRGSGS